jgi:2-C-methyl-D-erythritol 2,4-cyclodiphosphate synthase
MRVGLGWDTHRLVPGRPLLLGGVRIPHDRGEDGLSDGDVLIHAVIDALLGPAGLGDIGSNFPPGVEEYRGIDSRTLLRRVRDMLEARGLQVVNVDCVVILDRPKLLPHIKDIRRALAEDIGVEPERVNVKAKTAEGLGPIGAGEAVEAHAAALIEETTR